LKSNGFLDNISYESKKEGENIRKKEQIAIKLFVSNYARDLMYYNCIY